MLIIRGVKNPWANITDTYEPVLYYIMDVNFFREKIWEIKIYDRVDGEYTLSTFQRSFNGLKELVGGVKSKEKTLEGIRHMMEYDHKKSPKQFGHFFGTRNDLSKYITVNYFPWFNGKYSNDSEIIEEFKGHDIVNDYPEYLI